MGESKQFPYARAEGTAVSPARRALAGRATGSVTISPSRSRAANWRCVRGNLQLPRFIFTTGYVESSTDGETFERVGELKERRADDPPAVEADPCDPRRLDLRRQRLPLRDGAVARRQVNEEARRRFGRESVAGFPPLFTAGRPPERSAVGSPPPRRRLIHSFAVWAAPRSVSCGFVLSLLSECSAGRIRFRSERCIILTIYDDEKDDDGRHGPFADGRDERVRAGEQVGGASPGRPTTRLARKATDRMTAQLKRPKAGRTGL